MTDLRGPGVRAVLIGTGTHPAGAALPDVPAVAATVREIGRCLVSVCGVDPQQVDGRIDTADSGELASLIRSASSEADRLFLLYYVGHGLIDQRGRLHLATAATTQAHQVPYGQALPFEEVREAVFDAPRRDRGTVIVLDCCYSGRVTTDVGAPAQAGFAQAAVRGSYVMTSAASYEQALALPGEPYTAFSGELIRLLRFGDPDGPASLTLDGVYEYLSRSLADRGAPRPRRHVQDSVGRLVIAPNPAYRQPRIAPPRAAAGPSAPDKPPCPYKDLHAFEVEDHALFFGRDELVARLLERVRERVGDPGIQVMTGPSGVGKSSLLRAGLMHGIAAGQLGILGSAAWDQLPPLTPGSDPLLALATALAPHLPSGEHASGPAAVRRRLAAAPQAAADLVRRLRPGGRDNAGRRVVLVVDQFEEILTECHDEAARSAFIRALRAAALPPADGGSPAALVVIGLRSDFLGAFSAYPELSQALGATAFVVGPMSPDELREAITGPARAAGLGLADGLAEVLLRDADPSITLGRPGVAGQGILPHLSHALYTTWQLCEYDWWQDSDGRLQQGWSLTTANYQKSGGIQGALSASADAVYESLTPDLQQQAERILPALVQSIAVADTSIDTIRRARREELPSGPGGIAASDAVIAAFTSARLLTADGDYVEIAHEALLNTWGLLRQWADTDRERRVIRQQVRAAAATWRSEGRLSSGLLHGPRLAAARTLQNGHGGQAELPAEDAEYLTRSIRRARSVARRPTEVIIALVLLLAVAVVGGVYTLSQSRLARQQSNVSQANEMAAEATSLFSANVPLAMLLSLQAYGRARTPQTTTAMIEAAGQPLGYFLAEGGSVVNSVAYSPDGQTIAIGDSGGHVGLWSAATGKQTAVLNEGNQVDSVAYSPDGQTIAIGDSGGHVGLWSTATGKQTAVLNERAAVDSVAFSSDGQTIAAGDYSGHVGLWSTATGMRTAVLNEGSQVNSVAFSPDGQTIAAGDQNGHIGLWSTTADKQTAVLNEGTTVDSVAFRPHGQTIAAGDYSGDVKLWSTTTDKQTAVLPEGGPVYGVAFSRDGLTLAAGDGDGDIGLWNTATAKRSAVLAQGSAIHGVAFSPDGRTLAAGDAGGDAGGDIALWDTATSSRTAVLNEGSRVFSVAFSPDGQTIAVGDGAGDVGLWSTATDKQTAVLNEGSPVNSVAFSPNGKTIAAGDQNGNVGLWDTATDKRIAVLNEGNPVLGVAFSPDGRILAAGENNGPNIELSNTVTGKTATLDEGITVYGVAFSPDGRILAAGDGDGNVGLWDTAAGKQTVLDEGSPVTGGVAFSPDGRTLAAGDYGGDVVLWSTVTVTDKSVVVLPEGSPVKGVAFSPDGQTIAVGDSAGDVGLWDAATGQQITVLDEGSPVNSVAFSPDGQTIAAGDDSDVAVLLRPNLSNLTYGFFSRLICGEVQQKMTESQWAANVPGQMYQSTCPA